MDDKYLRLVEKQQLDAQKFGFDYPNLSEMLAQIESECKEVEKEWNAGNRELLEEEVGDLIHAAITLATFCKLDPVKTLKKSIDKFQKRYDALVKLVQEDGFDDLQHQPSFDAIMDYWKKVKHLK